VGSSLLWSSGLLIPRLRIAGRIRCPYLSGQDGPCSKGAANPTRLAAVLIRWIHSMDGVRSPIRLPRLLGSSPFTTRLPSLRPVLTAPPLGFIYRGRYRPRGFWVSCCPGFARSVRRLTESCPYLLSAAGVVSPRLRFGIPPATAYLSVTTKGSFQIAHPFLLRFKRIEKPCTVLVGSVCRCVPGLSGDSVRCNATPVPTLLNAVRLCIRPFCGMPQVRNLFLTIFALFSDPNAVRLCI